MTDVQTLVAFLREKLVNEMLTSLPENLHHFILTFANSDEFHNLIQYEFGQVSKQYLEALEKQQIAYANATVKAQELMKSGYLRYLASKQIDNSSVLRELSKSVVKHDNNKYT